MTRIISGVLLGLLLAIPFTVATADQNAVEELNRMLSSIKSMDTQFSQLVVDPRGGVMQEVNGQLTIQRPYKFRWSTGEPFFQNVISNGKLLWVYDLDLEQVTVQTLDRRVANTPALLLSGDLMEIAGAFDVTSEELTGAKPDQGGTRRFRLLPKNVESLFEVLTITFLNDVISEMHLVDSLGQQTMIEFKTVQKNITLAPSLFEFIPPKGVDIIEDF